MVCVAPCGRGTAAGELAVLVAQHDRPSESIGDGAGAAPEVEELAAAGDDPPERAVAQQPLGRDARVRPEAGDLHCSDSRFAS